MEEGGVVLFNSDRIKCEPYQVRDGVKILGLPMKKVTEDVVAEHGPLASNHAKHRSDRCRLLHRQHIGLEEPTSVLIDTFGHKGQKVVDLNIALLKAGYEFAKANLEPDSPKNGPFQPRPSSFR